MTYAAKEGERLDQIFSRFYDADFESAAYLQFLEAQDKTLLSKGVLSAFDIVNLPVLEIPDINTDKDPWRQ